MVKLFLILVVQCSTVQCFSNCNRMQCYQVVWLVVAARCYNSDHQGLLASTTPDKQQIPEALWLGCMIFIFSHFIWSYSCQISSKGSTHMWTNICRQIIEYQIVKMGKKPPPPKPEELIEKLDEKVNFDQETTSTF